MIEHIAKLVPSFGGAKDHTRCFLHVLNLVVKSIMRPFDLREGREVNVAVDAANTALLELAGNIEEEEAIVRMARRDNSEVEDDNIDGWVDEDEAMMVSDEERERIEEAMLPVREVLTKVCALTSFSHVVAMCQLPPLTAADRRFTAPQVRVCRPPFQYKISPSMDLQAAQAASPREDHASRCPHSLELHVPDARLRR